MKDLKSYLPWQHLFNSYSTWYIYPDSTSLNDTIFKAATDFPVVFDCPLVMGYAILQESVKDCRRGKERPYFRGSAFIIMEEPKPKTAFYDTGEIYLREFMKAGGTVYAWTEFHHDVIRLDFKKFIQSKLDVVR